MAEGTPQSTRSTPGHAHETRAVDMRAILIGMGAVTAMLLAVVAIVSIMFHFMPTPSHAVRRDVPEPHLQVHPLVDIAELRREKAAQLQGYAWVDARQGVVSIPIERAMAVLAESAHAPRRGETP